LFTRNTKVLNAHKKASSAVPEKRISVVAPALCFQPIVLLYGYCHDNVVCPSVCEELHYG